jgi:2,4-dienoyl-CoA reductase-like NADH-dependent reductase (Old Yellow Enzyme family)
VVSGIVCLLSYAPLAQSTPPALAQTEINYLLGLIERSGCMFYRNGSWYDARQAQAHLRSKYDALAAMGRIVTAEDFIEQAATKSSLSGEAYAIRCNSGPALTTDQWLRDALARYRLAAG